jgi:hypothetical protein
MSWTSGDVINTQTRLRRLSSSIPSSYTVFKIGDTYYAETNIAGGTDATPNTDAAVVLRFANAALSSTGGTIFLRKGTYVCSSLVEITNTSPSRSAALIPADNVAVIGESKGGTILQLGNSVGGSLIAFEDHTPTTKYGFHLQNLTLDGNKANQSDSGVDGDLVGLRMYAHQRCHIENVRIINCKRQGLYVTNGQWNNYIDVSCDSNDREGFVWDSEGLCDASGIRANSNGQVGIYIVGGASREITWVTMTEGEAYGNIKGGVKITQAIGVSLYGVKAWQNGDASNILDGFMINDSESVYLTDCQAYHNQRAGVSVYGDSTRVHIKGGCYYNNREDGASGNGFGIVLSSASYCRVTGVDAYDNQTPKKQLGGVQEVDTSDYNYIAFNDFRGNANTNPITKLGANTRMLFNRGCVTENSGTSTGTGAQQTIAHGLVSTPNRVFLSESTTGGALAYQSAAADATNIYVTATSAKTYQWRAEVV